MTGSCHGRRGMRWCHFGASLRSGRVQGERYRVLSWRRLDGALRSATSVQAGNNDNPLRRERRDDSEHVHPLAADSAQEGCSPKYPRFCAAADNHTGKAAERRSVRAPRRRRDRRRTPPGTGGPAPGAGRTAAASILGSDRSPTPNTDSRIPAPCTCWGCPRGSEPQAQPRRAARARLRQCGALASSLAQAPKQCCSVALPAFPLHAVPVARHYALVAARSRPKPGARTALRTRPGPRKAARPRTSAAFDLTAPHPAPCPVPTSSNARVVVLMNEIVPFSPTADFELFLDMAKKNLSACLGQDTPAARLAAACCVEGTEPVLIAIRVKCAIVANPTSPTRPIDR